MIAAERFRSVPEAFAAQVAICPEAIAVVCGAETLTFRELDARSNQLARYLQRRGVGTESIVGVRAEGHELIIALLGILKSGGAYLPLDSSMPQYRLDWILKDAHAQIVLWKQMPEDSVSPRGEICFFREFWPELDRETDAVLPVNGSSDGLAYVMYTSGSTGHPKGVAIPHAAVLSLVLNTNYITLGTEDRVAHASNPAFDAATFEIWGSLLNGARLICFERGTTLSPPDLRRELNHYGVTTLFLTTAIFHQVASEMPDSFRSLRTLIFGGEVCDPRVAAQVLRHGPPQRLLNAYGPTECATFALYHEIKKVEEGTRNIPIGKPVSGTEVLLLDANLQPVPAGQSAEICLGGPRLARGYLNHDELTEQRFVPHPFTPGARLYRTGDLARALPDGSLDFIGRSDHQVKLSGFRIELGEIDAALGTHPGVAQRTVLLLGGTSQDKRLVAYLTPVGKDRATPAEMRAFLTKRLPEYMIPSAFVWLDRLPITPTGKLDTDALRAIQIAGERSQSEFAPPQTPTEIELAAIWEDVLHVSHVGRDDNFFNLGGRSLIAASIFAKIRQRFGKSLTHGTLLREPTLRGLAAIVDSAASISLLVEIKRGGPKLGVFLVHGAPGGVFTFRAMAAHLGEDRPIYGIEAPWLSRPLDRHWTKEQLAALYLQEVRRIQPRGPYHIGGYSQGGSIAFEMAQRLCRDGDEVASLLLFDAFNHHGARRLTYRERIALNLSKIKGLSFPGKLHSLASRTYGNLKGMLALRLASVPLAAKPMTVRLRQADFVMAQIELLQRDRPEVYPGEITLFLCEQLGVDLGYEYDAAYGWEGVALGGLRVLRTPGAHESLFDEPHVRTLARQVELSLAGKP